MSSLPVPCAPRTAYWLPAVLKVVSENRFLALRGLGLPSSPAAPFTSSSCWHLGHTGFFHFLNELGASLPPSLSILSTSCCPSTGILFSSSPQLMLTWPSHLNQVPFPPGLSLTPTLGHILGSIFSESPEIFLGAPISLRNHMAF